MKTLLSIVVIVLCLKSSAQKQANNWYFGLGAGLSFNSSPPAALTDGQTYDPVQGDLSIEGTATISDSTGALLFYTNGEKIWNANQQVMPNGNGLLGNFSSTQAAIIVPQPGSSRYFYVFTVDDGYYDHLQYGFRYSIVDICLDNGLGDVVPGKKNILILDTVSEKLTAVRHANGTDYWIIVHKYFSDAFYAYRMSSSGITDTVISHIGSRHPSLADSSPVSTVQALGQMKVSTDGKKLAIVNVNSAAPVKEYFDFDNNTGIVSNWVNLQTAASLAADNQYYGAAFSPDNSKLYVSCVGPANGITQFDLNAGNTASIIASATIITTDALHGYYSLQLAPDGKIYSTKFVSGSGWTYVAAINSPNTAGINCNYRDSAIYLNGRMASYGLPDFITAFDYSNTVYNCNDTTPIILPVDSFVMPDAFTPNGDARNESFYPVFKFQDTTVVKVFKIYNRWGQLVFDDPTQGWDGTYKGDEQPAGTYTYYVVIALPDSNNQGHIREMKKEGIVTLIK